MRRVAPPLHIGKRMSNKLETITEELSRVAGGVSMKLTQFGYPHDPYSDSQTRKGNGAYHRLRADSVAMTDSGLSALGLTRAEVRRTNPLVDIHMKGGGILTRHIDDRAPEKDRRTDMYMPGGFNRNLPDRADITLHRG